MPPEQKGTTEFRPCESDGAWNLCTAALAKVIGEQEAAKPQWLRRMALSAKGSTPLLLITHCPWVSPFDPASTIVWERSDQGLDPLATEQRAHPIAEGVALLQSPENPELEIARRRGLMAEKRDRDQAARDAIALPAERERKRESELSDLRNRYGLAVWEKLDPATRALAYLGHLVRDKYPDLGAAVREAVHFTDREDAQTTLPRSEWWKRPTPEELAQHFPPEK
jgi:hypothetical protein